MSTTTLPDTIEVQITVSYCQGLRGVRASDFSVTAAQRQEAERRYEKAYDELRRLGRELPDAGAAVPGARSAGAEQQLATVDRLLREVRVARADILAVPAEGETLRPNAFVALTVEHTERIPSGAYTDVRRASHRPLWKQQIRPLRLADLSLGAAADQVPQALLFSVYHDDAAPEGKGPRDDTEDMWRRDAPQTDVQIAFAKWSFADIKKLLKCKETSEVTLPLQHVPKNAAAARDTPPTITFQARVTAKREKRRCLAIKFNC